MDEALRAKVERQRSSELFGVESEPEWPILAPSHRWRAAKWHASGIGSKLVPESRHAHHDASLFMNRELRKLGDKILDRAILIILAVPLWALSSRP